MRRRTDLPRAIDLYRKVFGLAILYEDKTTGNINYPPAPGCAIAVEQASDPI